MNRSPSCRRAFGLVALVFLGLATLVASVLFSQSAAHSPSGELPPREAAGGSADPGVVCFGHIDLEHGVTSLYPMQPGRVVEVLVRENDPVAAGAVLVRLEDKFASSRVTEAQAALEAAQSQLAQARKAPAVHQGRIKQQQDAVEAMRYRLSAARRALARKQKLQDSRLVGPEEVGIGEDQIKELEALQRVEEQRLTDLRGQDPASDVQRAENEVTVLKARLVQARWAVEECCIKAPKAGTVLRLLVGPGDVLSSMPRQPAVLFAAEGPLIVRAEVEQEFAGRVAEGQAVVVQDEADLGRTWRGQVRRIANWYSQRRSVMHEPFQLNDVRTVECLITLEAGPAHLRIGQRVRVLIGAVKP